LNSSRHMNGSGVGGALKFVLAVATLFCVAALGYLAGIRQAQATTGGPPKTYEINVWKLHLVLSLGAMGVAVIFALTVLLSTAALLMVIARRRRMRADRAGRELEVESKQRQRAEVALHQSHESLRAIFETALDAIITMDHEGRVAEFNPSAERIFGYRRGDVIGRPLADVIIPQTMRDRHRDGLAHYLATGDAPVLGKLIEMTGLRDDGALIDLELSINRMPGDGPPMFAGFLSDITERKQTEEARALLAAIVQSSDDAIIGKTLDGIILSWNPGAERLFGYSSHEVLGRPMMMLIPPERHGEEPDILSRIAHGESVDHYETVRIRKDGARIDVSLTISPMRDSQGKIVGASKIARDITERKAAEAKAQGHLVRMNLLHQITRAIGGRHDLRSIYQVVLRSLEEQLGFDFGCICDYDPTRQELMVIHVGVQSQPLSLDLALTEEAHIPVDANGLSRCVRGQLVYEPDITNVKMPFPQKLLAAGLHSLVAAPLLVETKVFGVFIAARRKSDSFSSGECEFLQQLSEHVALAAHQAELYASLQRAYDDLRQTQEAAMQQERLRALGQMASGIAHDINNALSPVPLYTQSLLSHEPDLSERAREYLTTIGHSIDDVTATLARMKEFYRQREPKLALTTVDLNHLVKQVSELTRARWSDMPQQQGYVIDMSTELASDLPRIMGIENEIRDAITNLIFNAVDAMPEGGTLTIRSKFAGGAAPLQDGSERLQVQLEVTDTGLGMDEKTQRRCLEPFFTTKGERGTGLGLAMVYGMVKRHGGDVQIDSAVGKGTTVRLCFRKPETITAQPPETGLPQGIASCLRILVIDDDPVLLRALRNTLEDEGHIVAAANGGQAGIDLFDASLTNNEPFAVVVTDLGMPHVDGRKVAAAVKAASPATPVVLLTGWGQRLVAEGETPQHVDCLLNKPLQLAELRKALVRVCRMPDPEMVSKVNENAER
jgi:PAS domain S-box-containing protein